MSISQSHLCRLYREFIDESPDTKKLIFRRNELQEGIKTLIYNECISKIPKEDLQVLEKLYDFFEYKCYYISDSRSGFPIYLEVPRSCPIDKNRFIKIDDFDCSEDIKEMGSEVLEITETLDSLRESFKRLVNQNTSLIWLKKHMPGVYKQLKSYD